MDKPKIIQILKKTLAAHSIKKAQLFGSFARGTKFNDIDLIIEPPKEFSLLTLSSLANEIERLTGFKADIVTPRGLSPHLKERIEKEAVAL